MFSRIVKNGFISFKRSGSSNIGTIFVLVITLSIITSLFLIQGTLYFISSSFQEKLGLTVYFQPQTSADDIYQFKNSVSGLPEVKRVIFISKEQALNDFKNRHKNDPLTIKALDVLGENPFYDSLNIQTQNASQYQTLNKFLAQNSFKNIIYKVDYAQKEKVINRLSSFISNLKKVGLIVSLIFVLVAILVTFNTIKLSISFARRDIETTKLIGGSNWFAQGPFVIQGFICGLLAGLITLFIFFFLNYFLGPKLKVILIGFDVFRYFMKNILILFLINLVGGIGIGILSSWLAVKKYSRV